ncbi:MAG TPA: TadE/TadG family type IV pilus assembly protein [Aurantimonas sp.]|uniref:Pilus assembly protein n=1 Tax=Aurantimonas marianensis TaxID=2920428 RepID=A0A9X2KET0_9HYPH|nr:TadE/TadG family type IV pilus assembly protein [Aurantimonas marianensis]MCP3055014.1 pilus assembly protein [Aurantimonas marianensis]
MRNNGDFRNVTYRSAIFAAVRSRPGFSRDRSGATAVEFAMVAAPFFMLMFAIIETFAISAAGMLLDTAVDNVARQVLTGQIQQSDIDDKLFRTKICDKVDFMLSCDKLKIDLRTFPAFGNIPTDIPLQLKTVDDKNFCFDPGSANSITVLRAFYEWPWVASFLHEIASDTNGNDILFSITAFMNEPFGDLKSSKSNCS